MLHEASDSGGLQTKIRGLQSISGGYSNTESFDGGGDAKQSSTQSCKGRPRSLGRGLLENRNSRLLCPLKLLLPVSPQVRYVSERTVEVFTANRTGRIELHNILHPNMSGKLLYKVQSLDLTDGEPRHRVTSRDTVDRTPFSVHGTFSGAIGIAKSICTPELNKVSVLKIWQGKEPIVVLRVNQLDNALLAVTNFHYLPVGSSLFVLDLISQSKLTVEPRRVFKATHPHILDVCWLWDHPARLLLSTVDSIRLFDIRCPNRMEQALFLNHSVTHMASNRYRTHVFAAFNENEIHIYDSRKLFGPIQQIKVPIDGCNILNSMRWNPYMPYELYLHFRGSSKILRCSAPDLTFDPFQRTTCDSFTSEEIFSMEQIWDSSLSADSIDLRLTTYKDLVGAYTLENYGEMFDKCKEDPESPMPLCWMAPMAEHVVNKEKDSNSMNTVCREEFKSLRRCKTVSENLSVLSPRPRIRCRVCSDSYLNGKFPEITANLMRQYSYVHVPCSLSHTPKKSFQRFLTFPIKSSSKLLNRLLYEHPKSILNGRRWKSEDNLKKENDVISYCSVTARKQWRTWSLSSLENSPCAICLCDDQIFVPRCTVDTTRQQPILEKEGTYKCSLCMETRLEKEFENIIEKHKDRLSFVFRQLGLDQNNLNHLCELQKHVELATNDDMVRSLLFVSTYPTGVGNGMRGSKVDNEHRIKLPYNIASFDFAPVGYSGVLCLTEGTTTHPKLVFAPFIAPDEGSAVSFEYAKALENIRVWESSDSIPFHLYQTMKLRLYNGMDKIDNDTPLLSILQGMADQIPRNWTQWLLNCARIQNGYCEGNDVSDGVEMVADDDDILIPERSAKRCEEDCHLLSVNVKGLPGILQLSTLESESDVVWHNCDSNHFTYIKIARSPIRRLILTPFRLPIDEERVVSDERFAASTDVLKQMPVIFLCLINGDSMRFIEYTLFIRRKLGKPVFTDSPCSFLNAFYFFSTVVYRYVNKISGAANKSSPKYVARRLRLLDKIYAFIKQQGGSSSLNPFVIPMLLFLHGEMTYTHPETFTRTVLENERMPLSFRIAWCLNLLSSAKMKEALHFLFQQSSGINRLQFVGLGRHPDSLTVLSEHLYVTQDCQVFSHLLVAGRCFEEDDVVPELADLEGYSVLNVCERSIKDKYAVSVPSLVTMFPTSYLHASNDMCDLLHLARAELYRYSFILQRMEKYCFRRKLLNLIPQIYWPDFKTSVDISCTFCGSSYEVALRNAESAISDHLSQVKSRISVNKTVGSRPSISMTSTSKSLSSSLIAASPDSDTSASVSATSAAESYSWDYNGVDGGTEAEIKRPPDSACPQCRKSYPRCCLCGLSYGTPVNDYDHPAGPFAMMFSTCLMCSHGGHTKHVISWFEKEDECPVMGCDCRCLYFEDGIDGYIKQALLTPF